VQIGDITVGMITRALDIYHRVAYAGLAVYKAPDLGDDPDYPITMFLDRFEDETICEHSSGGDSHTIHRYILRMGNCRYPFMKFVFQEHIVQGEYFFSVDTHDDMLKGNLQEGEEISKIREFNRWNKDCIERLWAEENLPTTSALTVLIQEQRLLDRRKPKNKTILVVDDDRDIGDTIQLVLEAMGYCVERLFDGIDAVEVADSERHDMIIMDNQMSEMDGLEALKFLKRDKIRRSIPVILATTQNMDLSRLELADAFLHKPFHAEALMSFVNHLFGLTKDKPKR